MVSVKFLSITALAVCSQAFQLLHDESGFAILPPTNLVLDNLKQAEQPESSEYYDVVSTINDKGEIVHVNMKTHKTKHTGHFRHKYDNSAYKNCDMNKLFARDDSDSVLNECFNVEYDWQTSQCGFDFVDYGNATDCSSDATKYSCVVGVMKSFSASEQLKNMDDVPAQVRCYHKLKDAQNDGAQNGACAK
ncbi:uncharacterized protein SPAPADRAFT_58378 [Spathaspora passalidarum NRRL Y-27907]|uniref:Uncharacterized protein n=1 Tax=Spathaspora passalidarum (strain NRRL Y-27907 / 11-Y1) TaxID=619300 RepID=G3AG46_SPAPN|nr:uncharacterized protein SPAPADRAFT_58378 [Spathaspora passalidarum NRRL Y-27907]EGW35185.1 hypothetical protein SPAPADRAFT_58378 [Spathaspora passalidarum NRRL Y-27907]